MLVMSLVRLSLLSASAISLKDYGGDGILSGTIPMLRKRMMRRNSDGGWIGGFVGDTRGGEKLSVVRNIMSTRPHH
jgi:hypothetical protein